MDRRSAMQQSNQSSSRLGSLRSSLGQVPILGWLIGMLVSTLIENGVGYQLAFGLGMSSIPPLFGVTVVFSRPLLIPSALDLTSFFVN